MEPIWLKSYPQGVPAEVDVGVYRSIGQLFDTTVAAHGPRAAFINMDKAISYDELDFLTGCFASYLQSVLRLQPSARVALMMPNLLQYPVALFGVLRAGYILPLDLVFCDCH